MGSARSRYGEYLTFCKVVGGRLRHEHKHTYSFMRCVAVTGHSAHRKAFSPVRVSNRWTAYLGLAAQHGGVGAEAVLEPLLCQQVHPEHGVVRLGRKGQEMGNVEKTSFQRSSSQPRFDKEKGQVSSLRFHTSAYCRQQTIMSNMSRHPNKCTPADSREEESWV